MKTLFDKTQIKGHFLKNRFFRAATWENMADREGRPTPELIRVYEELAAGGVGAIITGYAHVLKEEQPNPGMLGIYDDGLIEDHRSLVAAAHNHDVPIILQIAYGGSMTDYQVEGREIWGPSAVAQKRSGVVPKEMTERDIQVLIDAFAAAGRRAKAAGYDGVELHAAHGYLLSQFLSPYYNRRQDEYGGGTEKRGRIILEVYQAVRAAVGDEMMVMIKINGSDYDAEGADLAECRYVCCQLDKMGIDGVEISGGMNLKDMNLSQEGVYQKEAEEIAQLISAPVILVGVNRQPDRMENVLNTSDISYFSLSRSLLCEPDLVQRWEDGEREPARCVYCCRCFRKDGVRCKFRGRDKGK